MRMFFLIQNKQDVPIDLVFDKPVSIVCKHALSQNSEIYEKKWHSERQVKEQKNG